MLLDVNLWLLFIIGLASFRLTRLLVFDKITEFIRAPFFDEITETDEHGNEEVYIIPKNKGPKKFIGELLSCFWCTGIWVSAFLLGVHYFIPVLGDPFILIFAVAAIGSLLEVINMKLLG
ncbi:hypothetical protein JOC77_002447 [Peribacillus deserti]|uniref:Sporulation protein n=1 Tax=Peribacillus deserti TaxID=673318 RepID=A0ABS2QKK1_9BACI|nr:DUF1360 domain-containing protein [Peribacillus deserti]MBM7693008.1 hypothetical protein [Peribacillus deserti]